MGSFVSCQRLGALSCCQVESKQSKARLEACSPPEGGCTQFEMPSSPAENALKHLLGYVFVVFFFSLVSASGSGKSYYHNSFSD